MKKFMFYVLLLVCCVSLTGCFCVTADVKLNSDGSGVMNARTGISEKAYELMKSYQTGDTSSTEEMQPFTYNGKTYYGSSDSKSFSSVEEFMKKNEELGGDQVNLNSNNFILSKNSDGTFTMTLKLKGNENQDVKQSENTINSLEMSDEEKAQLLEDMVCIYTFDMPGNISQIEGDSLGITINGNILTVDLMKLQWPLEPTAEKNYSFLISNGEQIISNRFSDVPESLWSHKAINVLAEGGLVSGVGNGKFSPERGMKISEFCQVLANATGMESGADQSGYWAAKAIKSCIEKGYIYSHGEINSDNYSAVITREEAIAAMQLASGRTQLADKRISLQDIPDNAEISERYKTLVLQAYNSGLTTGVNAQLKFSPKSQLTRGQICQLFYNVGWTSAVSK